MKNEKAILRKTVREKLRLISLDERKLRSEQLFSQIEELPVFKDAMHVFIFWSMADEIDTHWFIEKWAGRKNIYLPVVTENDLELRLFETEALMKRDSLFGIFEPQGVVLKNESSVTLALVPALAFDRHNARLGRGKGFYDRVLPRLVNAYRIGIGFREQWVDAVPCEPHDMKMDRVILI